MKIAIYVQSKYAKANYKSESFAVRLFAGVESIGNILRNNGYDVDYCCAETASRFDIVLVSITSACDWWPFIAEKSKWEASPTVIVGGAGVLNIRPFLPHFDFAVLGRGENIIIDLIDNLKGFEHESVINSKTFCIDKKYKIAQATQLLEKITIGKGSTKEQQWRESGIGCKRKCLFCAYTWHRKFYSTNDKSYQDSGNDSEFTMLDIDYENPSWTKENIRLIGLDGCSEKMRYLVNKKISNEMFIRFMRGLAEFGNAGETKLFTICGLPGESLSDYNELKDNIIQADFGKRKDGKKKKFLLGFTPFRAMPATPAACWPMSYIDYRKNSISSKIKDAGCIGNVIYNGNSIWAVEWMGTDSLCSHILDAIGLRGVESDTDNIIKLVNTKKFWGLNSIRKRLTLEKYFDTELLFGRFQPEKLPTRYLKTYCKINYRSENVLPALQKQ